LTSKPTPFYAQLKLRNKKSQEKRAFGFGNIWQHIDFAALAKGRASQTALALA